jgi:Fe-S cluster assembly protein SufD
LGTVATQEGKLGSFNDDRFVWLNTANLADCAFLHVPKGVEVEPLIRLDFPSPKASELSHPRVLIVLEEGARAKILEAYPGQARGYLRNPTTEVVLGRSASLGHVRVQTESESAFHLGTLAVWQGADSNYASTVVSFGGSIARLDVQAWVGGEHCETTLNGIYVAGGEQLLDHHTRIDHAVPNCHSFEVYKGILGGKATGVFNGKIFVYEDAQKTDAKQTNQAMLLSKTASINTKPQLEIFADDVKCTHGATVGQLREDALFYLRSRGIPEREAQSLLIYAFAAEVLEQIGDEEVRKLTEDGLYEKLARIHTGGE